MTEAQYEERTIKVNRVAKVVKGGRRFSFTALMVVGDGNGKVGLGYGKAKEAGLAVQKGIEEAKKNLFEVPLAGSTITHPVIGKAGAGRVLLKPAAPGTGVIAGGAARAILEMAGIHDILAKSLGTSNGINVAHATIAGLRALGAPTRWPRLRGKPPEEVEPGRGAARLPGAPARDRPATRRWLSMPRTDVRRDGRAAPARHPGALGHRDQAQAPRHAARPRPAGHRSDNELPDRPEIRGMIARVPHLVDASRGRSERPMKLHDLAPPAGLDPAHAPRRPGHRRQGRQDRRPGHQGPGRPRHDPARLRGRPAAPHAAHPEAARLQEPLPGGVQRRQPRRPRRPRAATTSPPTCCVAAGLVRQGAWSRSSAGAS